MGKKKCGFLYVVFWIATKGSDEKINGEVRLDELDSCNNHNSHMHDFGIA